VQKVAPGVEANAKYETPNGGGGEEKCSIKVAGLRGSEKKKGGGGGGGGVWVVVGEGGGGGGGGGGWRTQGWISASGSKKKVSEIENKFDGAIGVPPEAWGSGGMGITECWGG